MTPKQILDSFSETLIQDERILNPRERTLVANFLQHAKSASSGNPKTDAAVSAVIASALGETVAQRAFAVLGASIVERIVESTPPSQHDYSVPASTVHAGSTPPNPQQPEPPHVKAPPPARDNPPSPSPPNQPEPPHTKAPAKRRQPEPPHNPRPPARDMPPPSAQPEPPHGMVPERLEPARGIAVLERPEISKARYLVLDEFLAPQELEELTRYTLEQQRYFFTSEVVTPGRKEGVANYEHRRSVVLEDPGEFKDLILGRIKIALPQILPSLGMEEFSINNVEAQITASNDGDFFHAHRDDGDARVAQRRLTFVYFFHREPRQFEGGELRIYDSEFDGDRDAAGESYQTIVPQQNQIVFFPCSVMHEITRVECPSKLFADSRFTLNGWLHK
jgi:Rps23 Pro-64 3,4-dihydroxylase Tpa1-like proline 4-hydroxylase